MRLRFVGAPSQGSLELAAGVLEIELFGLDADVELLDATLSIEAEATSSDDEIGPESAGLLISSSAGTGAQALDSEVTWVSVVWSARRSLEGVVLATRGATKEVTLSIADAGPWYPSSHPRLRPNVPTRSAQRIPALIATGALLRFFSDDDRKNASATLVDSLRFQLGRRPLDLSVNVGDGPSLASHAAAFSPGERWQVGSGLAEAIRRELRRRPSAILRLTSSSPAHLASVSLLLNLQKVVRTWVGGAEERSFSLCAGRETVSRLRVPGDRPVERLSLRTAWTSARERGAPLPDPIEVRDAQRVRPGWAYAQRIEDSRPGALIGVDLHLRLLTETARGRLWITPDRDDKPVEPLGIAQAALELNSELLPTRSSSWASFDLPIPLAEGEGGQWLVVEIDEGEFLWTLSPPNTPNPEGRVRALYRSQGEPWSPRRRLGEDDPAQDLSAHHRLRRASSTVAPAPTLSLRRVGGEAPEHPLLPSDDGVLALSPEALTALNQGHPGAHRGLLEIVIRSDHAGTLRLFELRAALAPKRSVLTPREAEAS